jgi:6-hydroxytryprostatin B O-methyltransferase
MRPGGRIVVVDIVLPPPGTVSPLQEASLRVFDLAMAQTFNSSERDRSDWIELFASTTPALRLRCELQPFGSLLTVMEVVRDE